MSPDVSHVMRNIRESLENIREKADDSLAEFANQVAYDARQHAPVRKAYTSRRKGAMRRFHRDPNIEEAEMLFGMGQAAGYEFRRHTGWENLGTEDHPRWKPTWQVISEPEHGFNKPREPRSPVEARNRAKSKWRVLGTYTTGIKRTNVVSHSATLRKPYKSRLMRGPKQTAVRDRPRITGQDISNEIHFVRRKGVRIDLEIERRESDNKLIVTRVNSVGKGLLRNMNAKQKYDLLHGRGVRFIESGRAGHGKVVMGGALRDSINAVEGDKRGQYVVEANIRYARYVEFGTRYMAAQPFLMPAMINARKRMARAIAQGVRG